MCGQPTAQPTPGCSGQLAGPADLRRRPKSCKPRTAHSAAYVALQWSVWWSHAVAGGNRSQQRSWRVARDRTTPHTLPNGIAPIFKTTKITLPTRGGSAPPGKCKSGPKSLESRVRPFCFRLCATSAHYVAKRSLTTFTDLEKA